MSKSEELRTIEEEKRDVKLPLESLKLRCKNSMSPPQRILKQMFKQFFENRIVLCNDKFYCCYCKKFMVGHCAAFEHTSETDHCNLIERDAATRRSWILLSDKTNFKLLVSEAIISFDANNFKCRICSDEMFAICKLAEHLENFWHRFWYLQFDQTSIEKRDATLSVSNNLDRSCILKDNENTRCSECIICPSKFSSARASNRTEENNHKPIMRYTCQNIVPRDGTHYRCNSGANITSAFENLQLRGGQHSRSILNSEKTTTSPKLDETAGTNEARPSPVVQMKTSRNMAPLARPKRTRYPRVKSIKSNTSPEEASLVYLFWRQSLNTWLCKICDKTLTKRHEITEHATETKHMELFKKYGCENITMIAASVYNCACCSCTIPGTKNVFAHLTGTRHSTCLAAMLRDRKSETEKSSTINQSDILSSGKKPQLIIYVQHFQGLSMKKMENRRLRAQKQSAPMENFQCNYCQVHIVNGTDFHNHLASHISHEFGNSMIDENANDPHNFGLEKQPVSSKNRIKTTGFSLAHLMPQNSSNHSQTHVEKKKKLNFF